jgi:hypothetical protein
MPMLPVPAVTLTPVAHFPEKYFLENLAARADGSVLITAVLQKELWYVPRLEPRAEVSPVLVHAFDHPVTGIAEIEPDVFIVSLTEGYTTHESHLARIDFNGWTPGKPISPEVIFTFDDRVRALNGSCLLGPGVLAVADCFAGLIWRVDLGRRVRLRHPAPGQHPRPGPAGPPARQRGPAHRRRPVRPGPARPIQRGLGTAIRRLRPGRLRDHRRRDDRTARGDHPQGIAAAGRTPPSLGR